MNRVKLSIFLPFLIVGIAFADPPQSVGPISFGGGLNTASLATLIPDDDSPDMCNCLPEVAGTMSKRNGTDRFISQAISSNSVTSLYRTYASSVSWRSSKVLIGSSYDKIFIATGDVDPLWVVLSSGNQDQHYSYVTMNGKVMIAGDKLTENIRKYDILNLNEFVLENAFTVNVGSGLNPRAKHQIVSNNYYIIANVQISTDYRHLANITTYYSNRILYSQLNNSSMTIQRYIDYNTNDGEEITGLRMLYGGSLYPGADFKNVVNVFKPSGIGELLFTVLDLPSLGGDWTFTEIARGIGCIAPRTLDSNGQAYIFLDKSGVMMWDRDQSVVISKDIKPLIDDLIRSGRYKSAVGKYYPKKQQYWMSFEHPDRFPKGKNNYILIYDFRTGKWFPLCNLNAESFTVADNQDDTGQMYYGDSNDGYVHLADVETRQDDSRKEISIDVMDSSFTWVGSSQDIVNVKMGTASVKLSNDVGTKISSMTKLGIFNFGEWYDKTRVTSSDKLHFKAFAHDLSSITSLRIDFEVKSVTGSFDTNFTSYSISSGAFSGNRIWSTFEIPLSSFPEQPDWTDLGIETVPFYNRFNFYGMRFVLNGIYQSSVSISDIRIVGERDNPNRMYRFTKLFDFQSPSYKGFGQLLLLMDKSPDASFAIDIYNDFGQKIRTEKVNAEVPKEILLFHKDGVPGFALLDSGDFSVKRETKTVDSHWNCLNGVMDSKKIVCGDRGEKNRLISFDRNDFSTFSLTYGEFGSGTSNFNLIHEIAQFPGGYLISDLMNQRTKIHSYSNMGFLRQYGQLGIGGTSYHQPAGVAANNSNFFVSDESNNRLLKLDQSTFSISAQIPVDHNIIAESSLAASDKYLFMAYNSLSPISNDILEVFLERRDVGNLDLLQRVTLKPMNEVFSTSSYRMQGSIGLLGKYIFVGFNNECFDDGTITYYLQKRIQSNFDLVEEYSSTEQFFSVAGYSLAYNPITRTSKVELKVEGRYVQLKFYDEDLDNYWRLYQMSPFINVQPLTY